ncbi:galaxin-2-like isoform X2 [Anneissia japonica]|uniref:galaxin-2-like isoform X2 n=1 Tax=Anneissia japonica TaxID=1529436 RepID=UPI00142569DE|nr:galaxin-2-like isoform X2 [Anneissia japonica]
MTIIVIRITGKCVIGNTFQNFNEYTHTCCDGVIYQKPMDGTTNICCGQEYLSTHAFKCCNELRRPVSSPDMCCGLHWYNPETHGCCNNKVYDKRTGKSLGISVL